MSETTTTTTTDNTNVVKDEVLASRETPMPEIKTEAAKTDTTTQVDAKTTETKTTEAPKVPEKYELVVPDGFLLDKSHTEKIAALAKEQGFSQEQAQKFLERDNSLIKDWQESQTNQLYEMSDAWAKELEADKEYGGEKFKENVALASKVIDTFFPKEFKAALEETRYGNYPDLFKGLAKIGREMEAGKFVLGGTQATAKPKTREEKFYGPEN